MPEGGSIDASVVVPVYNDQSGVERLLSSLSRQTYPLSRFEVVVVDNDSTPRISLPENLPFAVSLLNCTEIGSYSARNAGVDAAIGNILAFTDADCEAHENWLEAGIHGLRGQSGRAFAGGEILFQSIPKPNAVQQYQLMVGFFQKENIEDRMFTATANLFCFRDQFDVVGKFDASLLSGGDRVWSWQSQKNGYRIMFNPNAIIYTDPRSTLRGAVIQARRVVGGRRQLRQANAESVAENGLKPHRGIVESVRWILSQDTMGLFQRIKILVLAIFLKLVQIHENLRLVLGKQPERR